MRIGFESNKSIFLNCTQFRRKMIDVEFGCKRYWGDYRILIRKIESFWGSFHYNKSIQGRIWVFVWCYLGLIKVKYKNWNFKMKLRNLGWMRWVFSILNYKKWWEAILKVKNLTLLTYIGIFLIDFLKFKIK